MITASVQANCTNKIATWFIAACALLLNARSAKTEEREDSQDYDDQTYDIDNSIHCIPPGANADALEAVLSHFICFDPRPNIRRSLIPT